MFGVFGDQISKVWHLAASDLETQTRMYGFALEKSAALHHVGWLIPGGNNQRILQWAVMDSKAPGKHGENCDSDSGATKSATTAVSGLIELRELIGVWDSLPDDAKAAIGAIVSRCGSVPIPD